MLRTLQDILSNTGDPYCHRSIGLSYNERFAHVTSAVVCYGHSVLVSLVTV